MKTIYRVAVVVLLLSLFSCSFDDIDSTPTSTFSIDEISYTTQGLHFEGTAEGRSNVTLYVTSGGVQILPYMDVAVEMESGHFSKTVRWIADSTGDYVLHAYSGTAYISKPFTIKALEPADGVEIEEDSIRIKAGESKSLNASLTPQGSDAKIEWRSSNNLVVKVDDGGNLTPVSKGEAVITASANGHSDQCIVFVDYASLELSAYSFTIQIGSNDSLSIVMPQGFSEKDIVMTNPNGDIAKVLRTEAGVTIDALSVGSTSFDITVGMLYSAKVNIHIVNKPVVKELRTYNFLIQITKDFDKVIYGAYSEDALRNGITISAEAYNAEEALRKACRENGIEFDAYSGSSGSQDLRGWINSMFGLRQYQDPIDKSLWTYWVQYKEGVYNQLTLGYYTEGGNFQIIWKTTKDTGGLVPEDSGGNTTTTTDKDGNTTTTNTKTEKKEDGTVVNNETSTVKDKDGNIISETVKKEEIRNDGTRSSSVSKTENYIIEDGTRVSETSGFETQIDKDGNTLNETQISKKEEIKTNGVSIISESSETTERDSSGEIRNKITFESKETKTDEKTERVESIHSRAADGSFETRMNATIADGVVINAESITTISTSDDSIGLDQVQSAIYRSTDVISRSSVDDKEVSKTIEVSGPTVVMDSDALGLISDHGAGLRLTKSEVDSIHLDGDACRTLSQKNNAQMNLSMKSGNYDDLLESQKSAIGNSFFILLNAMMGDEDLHDLGGRATVTFGYLPQAGVDVSKLRVWYVDDNGDKSVVDSASFDSVKGVFSMELTHFSVYMVAEEEDGPSSIDSSTEDSTGIKQILLIATLLIIATVSVVVVMMYKKRA